MKGYTKLPIKQFYRIVIPLGLVILLVSLETFAYVKDGFAFERWLLTIQDHYVGLSDKDLFTIYVNGNIALYFQKIIIPMGLGVHSYFAYKSMRINKLFVFIWVILLGGSIAYSILGSFEVTVLLILSVLLQVFVIGVVLSLLSVIDHYEKESVD